ncbi:hypothetical protein PAL_GLEAN10016165 [Pteropus alecto]|uniref:Uncharacterized protein n=1 Tax=Pteropus alecto TaxID=9402 RepID=L5KUH0_PTEAL|nr:hypothetical protein PAL_GLEAN10016165 [Pteropus alecto]
MTPVEMTLSASLARVLASGSEPSGKCSTCDLGSQDPGQFLGCRELFLKELSGPISVSVDHPAPMLVICSNEKAIPYILIAHSIHLNLLASFCFLCCYSTILAFLGNLTRPTCSLRDVHV